MEAKKRCTGIKPARAKYSYCLLVLCEVMVMSSLVTPRRITLNAHFGVFLLIERRQYKEENANNVVQRQRYAAVLFPSVGWSVVVYEVTAVVYGMKCVCCKLQV